MAVRSEIEGSSSQEEIVKAGISQNELSIYVPDYDLLIHQHLWDKGILETGRRLDLIFPAIPHPNSQAQYIYEDVIGNDWIFIAIMKPFMETSKHRHPTGEIDVREEYEVLAGKIHVHLGEDSANVIELPTGSSMIVPSYTYHRATTDGHFGFYIARMIGAASIPRDRLHIS